MYLELEMDSSQRFCLNATNEMRRHSSRPMLEMVIQGVSTRRVSKIVEELCGTQASKSFVSSLTSQLDQHVQASLQKKFRRPYPFIFNDVLAIKVRENHRVLTKAFHLVVGINAQRE